MKKLFLLFILLTVSCAGVMPDPQNCTIYQEYGATPMNSLIADKIKDPCLARRLISTSAKLPAIQWKKKYTEEFEIWAAKVEAMIQDNISYADLQDIVLLEVSKLNAKAGLVFLIVSDEILVFNERDLLKDKDVELLLGLIKHLRTEVAKMAILAQ